MSTPVFDNLLSEVLKSVHVARARLASVRTGIDRLHAPDEHEQCPLCREAWPCATRQLVDGTARGDLDAGEAQALVDDALAEHHEDTDDDELADGPQRLGALLPSMTEMLQDGRTSTALDALLSPDPPSILGVPDTQMPFDLRR